MPATATIRMNACDIDDLDATPAWTEGLRVLETFLCEVGVDEDAAVVPDIDSRAAWSVGELEVSVLWIYGAPVIEMRTGSDGDQGVQKRIPLAETVAQTPTSSGQPMVRQDPVSKDGLWDGLHLLRAA